MQIAANSRKAGIGGIGILVGCFMLFCGLLMLIVALWRGYREHAIDSRWVETPAYVYSRTIDPESAPDKPTIVEIAFENGDPVAIDGKRLSPAALLTALNTLGHDNGIGRLDLVENRYVGMKSRGMYETPGGTILLAAHRAIESITLDRGAAHLKDELMPKYAELIYNGFWFAPERELLQTLIDRSQELVAGRVRLKLYKGNIITAGRKSPVSLYNPHIATMEADPTQAYNQSDATGFINLNALRLKVAARVHAGGRV